ncbi:DUF4955 domain-containing protein [Flexithrix dorotheae]|uniref:DUF4955 domain-containing protein n=1 Tax=Flexithrix dorotheae TaxID=70993 RepID=UPI0003678B5A|nr:DUF4955 domain-containing protein [Flexithrix dorotheae]
MNIFNYRIAIYILLACIVISCEEKQLQNRSLILDKWENHPEESRLIDFSYAGYKKHKEKPDLTPEEFQKFRVEDYGAIPNDGKDDIDAIQRAVDAAAAAGGGIVVIGKGTFDFDVNTKKRFVHIRHSNITIIGAGEGNGGTVLHDHTPSDYPDPSKKWLGAMWPSFFLVYQLEADSVFFPFQDDNNLAAHLGNARKGSFQVPITKDIKVEAGKTYLLTMENEDSTLTQQLIYPLKKSGNYWWSNEGDAKYKVRQMVTVEEVSGENVTLDAPLLWELSESFKPKLWEIPIMVKNVGIAGIKMTTDWQEDFIHHKDAIHDGGWSHIRMSYCEDSWVQNTIHENATAAVGLGNSKNCSVWHARIKGNIGHNGFNIAGFSTRNLLYNLHAGKAYHTFAISAYSSGNVYFNSYSDEPSGIDLHGGVGVHNLFDNIIGPQFRHGGSRNALPPAMGNGVTIWNYKVGLTEPYKGIIKNSIANFKEIPGFVLVGIQPGKGQDIYMKDPEKNRYDGNYDGEWGQIEYWKEAPKPGSLFRYQLEKRLGKEIHTVIDLK